MNKGSISPLNILDIGRLEKAAKLQTKKSPKRPVKALKLNESIIYLNRSCLPKIKVFSKNLINPVSSGDKSVLEKTSRKKHHYFEPSQAESMTSRYYMRKLPARFKQFVNTNKFNVSESIRNLYYNKTDLELIHNNNPDKLKSSLEKAKNIKIIEDNFNKGKILKTCKENSWKWLTPKDTPSKSVRFAMES